MDITLWLAIYVIFCLLYKLSIYIVSTKYNHLEDILDIFIEDVFSLLNILWLLIGAIIILASFL